MHRSTKLAHSRRSENAEAHRREGQIKTGQECSLGSVKGSSYPLQGQLCEVRMSQGSLGREPALHCKTPRGGLRKPIVPVPMSAHSLAPASSRRLVGSLPVLTSLPPQCWDQAASKSHLNPCHRDLHRTTFPCLKGPPTPSL